MRKTWKVKMPMKIPKMMLKMMPAAEGEAAWREEELGRLREGGKAARASAQPEKDMDEAEENTPPCGTPARKSCNFFLK
jgi:hypothetical protein